MSNVFEENSIELIDSEEDEMDFEPSTENDSPPANANPTEDLIRVLDPAALLKKKVQQLQQTKHEPVKNEKLKNEYTNGESSDQATKPSGPFGSSSDQQNRQALPTATVLPLTFSTSKIKSIASDAFRSKPVDVATGEIAATKTENDSNLSVKNTNGHDSDMDLEDFEDPAIVNRKTTHDEATENMLPSSSSNPSRVDLMLTEFQKKIASITSGNTDEFIRALDKIKKAMNEKVAEEKGKKSGVESDAKETVKTVSITPNASPSKKSRTSLQRELTRLQTNSNLTVAEYLPARRARSQSLTRDFSRNGKIYFIFSFF